MSGPGPFSASVLHGTTSPATLDSTYDIKGFLPGQTWFFSFFYQATRNSGSATATLASKVRWWDASNVELTATTQNITIDASTGAFVFFEGAHVAPATAVRGRANFTLTANTGATFVHDTYVTSVRVAKTEAGADVVRWVEGPQQSATFKFNYDGSAATGEFPRDLGFKLKSATGQITSGITWTYSVTSGTFNGFTSANGSQSMSGTGTGTLTASSLGSTTATILVNAHYQGRDYPELVDIVRSDGQQPISGTGSTTIASSSSFSVPALTTSFQDLTATPALNGSTPAGITTANINVVLNAVPVGSTSGSWTVEVKVQRLISGVWTDVGSARSAGSLYTHFGGGEPDDWTGASFSFSQADTGLTASTAYQWRIVARVTSGSRGHNFTGTVTVTT